jgi:hypothetical protein
MWTRWRGPGLVVRAEQRQLIIEPIKVMLPSRLLGVLPGQLGDDGPPCRVLFARGRRISRAREGIRQARIRPAKFRCQPALPRSAAHSARGRGRCRSARGNTRSGGKPRSEATILAEARRAPFLRQSAAGVSRGKDGTPSPATRRACNAHCGQPPRRRGYTNDQRRRPLTWRAAKRGPC